MAKQEAMATKRQVTRLMKESADLWSALTEVEVAQNVIISKLLEISSLLEIGADVIEMSIEQAHALLLIRERFKALDSEIAPLAEQ